MLRAQLHLVRAQDEDARAKHMPQAEAAAAAAVARLCEWGCAWDKRVPWEGIIGWSRVLHSRARAGEAWPTNAWEVINFGIVDRSDYPDGE
mmetsp:Transcript_2196/g.6628  ORF Transcript_2196/g.6628 Transcript_2196/m.6628 type:complete len:91 (-) Transcript_2196:313-585(-)